MWLPARGHVKEALEQRAGVDPSGQVIKLNTFCPWKEHLHELEEEMGIGGTVKYCLYEVSGGGLGSMSAGGGARRPCKAPGRSSQVD